MIKGSPEGYLQLECRSDKELVKKLNTMHCCMEKK